MEYTLMGSIKKLINENLKRPMYLWNNHSNSCGVIGRFSNNYISCKYYWGEHVLNFKLSILQLTISISLSVIYYLYCIVYKKLKRKADIRLITILFVTMPILAYHISSSYDYRITISFALFHCTFYVLFFATRYIRKEILTHKQ